MSEKELVMRTAGKALAVLSCCAVLVGFVALVADSAADVEPDKYSVKVPGGLAFSEFKGYESWETVSVSYNGHVLAVTVANPVMINAYKAGFPANGKPAPEGAKLAKIHWMPKPNEFFPDAM